MAGSDGVPIVSVVVPTFRRPEMLARAVESVLGQEFRDFEVIICDDEDPPGEGRLVAERLAARDSRVRVLANEGVRGQAGNLNFAMSRARGAWIKPVFDDDALEPSCLGRMLAAAVMGRGSVSVVRCLVKRFENGRLVRTERRGRRAAVEQLSAGDAVLAMYLQDVDVGIPTQLLVSRHALEAGAVMATDGRFVSNVDSAWTLSLLEHGSLVLLNEPLVHQHQGGHTTVTSGMSDDALDAEFALLRELQHERLGGRTRVPSVSSAQAMLRAIRALERMRRGRLRSAVSLAADVRSVRAWGLAVRWAMRRAMPGWFEIVKRTRLSTDSRAYGTQRDPGVRIRAQRSGAHDGVSDAGDRRAVG
ncbi:MAG: glycosyltransferase family 2 protein [Phycisphaerales bacterium]|nr:glycosyltransferase family 2 protein [Phycisphaerales bacterium]